jgi:hypothetical protein
MDETRAPVLDPGSRKTKSGYFWALARDDRPWGGGAPPGVAFTYAPGRGGQHAETYIARVHGHPLIILQAVAHEDVMKNRRILAVASVLSSRAENEGVLAMKIHPLITATFLLISTCGVAQADDHLFQAEQHGLKSGSTAASTTHAFTTNSAGHSGTLAPGQGSPFTGHDTQTPATDTDAANEHANVKPR